MGHDGSDGGDILGGLVFDAFGNLYGTAVEGGTFGNGVIYKLSPQNGGGWLESVLYSFSGGTDGGRPTGTLVLNSKGLYGITQYGGTGTCVVGLSGCGTVFTLTYNGTAWIEKVLYAFTGSDGGIPYAGLMTDSKNNLYGTTTSFGRYNEGVVFEIPFVATF